MLQMHPLQSRVSHLNWKMLYDYLKQNNQLDNPEVVQALLYIRGYHDFEFFAQYFFPHHCRFAFSQMHLDFCQAETQPTTRYRREAIAAPRGNAKTTFKTLFKVIHAIVYGYEPFILVMSHCAPEAQDKVKTVLDELENNPRLLAVYGKHAPEKSRKNQWVTPQGTMVMAKSKGQQIRG